MAWQYVQYEYPITYNFDKFLIWLSANCHCYFGLQNPDTSAWDFYSGNASHELETGLKLVNCGSSEATAQSNYWLTSIDTEGKAIALLPLHVNSKTVRIYIDSAYPTTIHEFKPSTFLLADEMTTGELRITNQFLNPPIIHLITLQTFAKEVPFFS